jgi:hypothetical protein
MSWSTINLSNLNGINDFIINGIDADDYSGTSISSAGDVKGDGIVYYFFILDMYV